MGTKCEGGKGWWLLVVVGGCWWLLVAQNNWQNWGEMGDGWGVIGRWRGEKRLKKEDQESNNTPIASRPLKNHFCKKKETRKGGKRELCCRWSIRDVDGGDKDNVSWWYGLLDIGGVFAGYVCVAQTQEDDASLYCCWEDKKI